MPAFTGHAFIKALENPDAKVVNGRPFPLTLGPASDHKSADSLSRWVESNRDEVVKVCMEYGAIMFRGFAAPDATAFAKVVKSLHLENMPYVGGAAVRRDVVGDFIFTANESPPSEPIPFHHEMAQVPNPPKYVMFYCETPPQKGGETPLILSNQVYNFFKETYPVVCQKVETLGVRYVRTMPEEDDVSSAIGRSWKNTFIVNTKEECEAKMREIGTEWDWLPNGDLRTVTAIVPGVRSDPRQQSKMFFNSIVAAYTGWIDSRNDPTKSVLYGNNELIDGEALLGVAEFMKRERSIVPWQQGDMVIIDNTCALHSRNTYEGARRVLASVGRTPLPFTCPAPVEDESVEYSYAEHDGEAVIAAKSESCLRLKTGDFMPKVGFGLWKISKDTVAGHVVDAVKAGYRHFDSACDYANEKEVGAGIKAAIDQGLVTREELWITSKLWNTYHSKEHVLMACKKSLEDLGLEYLDLYLIHFPMALKYVPFEVRYPPEWLFDPTQPNPRMEFAKVTTAETWRAMEDLVSAGLVRNIGMCNFTVQLLRDVLNFAKVSPTVLQVELHPLNTQKALVQFAHENQIVVTGFSPLGHASYIELGMSKANESAMLSPKVAAIATKHGKTPAQVILRWNVQRDVIIIPKSSSPARMAENIDVLNWSLAEDEMAEVESLNLNRRFNDPVDFCQGAFNTFAPLYN